MRCELANNKGTTLIEILVSTVICVITVTAAASTILSSQFLASYSKHRLEAMFVAQQIIEQERRLSYANLVSVPSAQVVLDNNGNLNNPNGDFMGNAVITVTTLDVYRKQVQVQVNWLERVLGGTMTMREYYSTDIANDPLPN